VNYLFRLKFLNNFIKRFEYSYCPIQGIKNTALLNCIFGDTQLLSLNVGDNQDYLKPKAVNFLVNCFYLFFK